jgi:hypothetical protein
LIQHRAGRIEADSTTRAANAATTVPGPQATSSDSSLGCARAASTGKSSPYVAASIF